MKTRSANSRMTHVLVSHRDGLTSHGLAVCILMISWLSVSAFACPPRYAAQAIEAPDNCGSLPPTSVRAESSNEFGVVTGSANICSGTERSFRWSETTGFQLLPFPSNVERSWANAINDAGLVIGYAEITGGPNRGYSHTGTVYTPLDIAIGALWAEAFGINSANLIVGWFAYDQHRACRWINGWMEDLAVGLPLQAGSSEAHGVNQRGVITGYMGKTTVYNSHAFIWDNYQVTDLGLPFPDAVGLEGTSINNSDHVCGMWWRYSQADGSYSRQAFLYDGTSAFDLPTLPIYPHAFAYDLNDQDQVVGWVRSLQGGYQACLWQEGQVLLLRDLVWPPLNWHFDGATSITNTGQIVGWAYDYDRMRSIGFLITPLAPVVGDVTCDYSVDIDDLLAVLLSWGAQRGPADLNHDLVVNIDDLLLVIFNWSQ